MCPARNEDSRSRKKTCVACKELIPFDATICSHCKSPQTPAKSDTLKTVLKWIGAITAAIGLITGLSGIVGPMKGWWTEDKQAKAMLMAAQSQSELGELEAALGTYSDLLKIRPGNVAAIHGRLDVAMLMVEDFRVSGQNDDELNRNARDYLQRVSPILEAGLSDDKGYRAADVVAHIGWVNWLRASILYEDANVDDSLKRAIEMDPTNVYAHAMLGNLVLHDHGSLDEAKRHFEIALKGIRGRSFVRDCQLGAMIYNDDPGVRAELIQVANDMRKHGEPISEDHRGRIHNYYDPTIGSDEQLREVLTAVPPDEAWATYQWVDRPLKEWDSFSSTEQQFIQASLYEFAGKNDDALRLYHQLERDTASYDRVNLLARRIKAAIKRLSH